MGSTADPCEEKGVSGHWRGVNHIALVVADVGKSLQFYADVVGMKQVLRPDFDRCGKKNPEKDKN